jgi:rare lipoprotein A
MKRLLALALCLSLGACASAPEKPERKLSRSGAHVIPLGEAAYDHGPATDEVPSNLDTIPDAVPKDEPKAASGNAPEYEALGRHYEVLPTASGYKERGRASWYGKHFQGKKTASGEAYDMYAMTAAHRTLPLPSYVRVTNVKNHKTVVVRINDRGPFHPDRIIDLSYAAASRIDIVDDGEAAVELEAIMPGAPPPGRTWLQVGAFPDPISAVSLREDLQSRGIDKVEIWPDDRGGSTVHRVVVGPFDSEDAGKKLRDRLLAQGLQSDWIQQHAPAAP